MLLNDLFRRTFCFAIDDAGGGAAATAAASAAAETAAVGGSGQGQATQTGSEVKPECGDKSAESSDVKLSEENYRRMARAMENLQKENARLKQGKTDKPAEKVDDKSTQTKVDTPFDSSDPMKHPAIKGLKPGEEDGTVIFRGAEVPAEFVIGLHEEREAMQSEINGLKGLEGRIDELRSLIDGDQTARSHAQIEQAQAAVYEATQTALVAMREQVLPNLPKELASRVDKNIFRDTDDYLTEETGGDISKVTPELIEKSAKKALDDARTLFGIFGAKQVDGNSRYASEHPVKPDGQPGTHKPAEPQTHAERLRDREERSRMAESKAEARR
jgi:hypothetical protein